MKITALIVLFTVVLVKSDETDFDPLGLPLLTEHPCLDTSDIVTWFDPGLPPREKNRYYVLMNRILPENSVIQLSFDSDVYVLHSLGSKNEKFKKIFVSVDEILTLRLVNRPKPTGFGFIVKGIVPGTNPYFDSIVINGEEVCNQPNVGYLEEYIAETIDKGPQGNCGKRQIDYTELVVKGANTKPGDWPWHTAIYKLERNVLKYICGGTLISKNYVLSDYADDASRTASLYILVYHSSARMYVTEILLNGWTDYDDFFCACSSGFEDAAHCASSRGVPLEPDILNIVLGKFNLIGGDVATQERAVHKIIIHEKFYYKKYDNDIALLKLKSEALFTDFVQPACLWFNKADVNANGNVPTQVIGTIVGWGFDSTDNLTRQLRQARMPMISDNTCMKSNPLFYANVLNGNRFCAGYQNGTSACNGDSGGGFHVFVPDITPNVDTNSTGSWYVRGIISVTLSRIDVPICDPTKYVVFTDVEKYRPWIDAYLENEREDQ